MIPSYYTALSVTAWILLSAAPAACHMSMVKPPPFKSKENPFSGPQIDYNLNAPISASQFPCKGYHKELAGKPEGAPVETWAAGSAQSFTIGSGASHNGGSCQASISEDGGATFKVVKSYIGGCPTAEGGTFEFNVPKETKSGNAIFSWTWFNKIGNREMYMNCAAVTITGGGSGLSSYPDVFTANIGNDCRTLEGKDVLFPNPGPSILNVSSNSLDPVGSACGPKEDSPPTSAPPEIPVPETPTPSATSVPTPQPSNKVPESPSCHCVCGTGPGSYNVKIDPFPY